MAIFVGVHKMPGVSEEEMQFGWERYRETAIKHKLKTIRVHISPSTGMVFCITEAPSQAEVAKTHQEASVQVPEEIIEVKTLE